MKFLFNKNDCYSNCLLMPGVLNILKLIQLSQCFFFTGQFQVVALKLFMFRVFLWSVIDKLVIFYQWLLVIFVICYVVIDHLALEGMANCFVFLLSLCTTIPCNLSYATNLHMSLTMLFSENWMFIYHNSSTF